MDAKTRAGSAKTTVRAEASASALPSVVDRTLGSPIALATLVLLLVGGTGFVATASSYRALERASEAHAQQELASRAGLLRVALGDSLAVADPLLDRIGQVVAAREPSAPMEPLLDLLGDLALARSGLTWASVSFPDGTFVGVYTEGDALRGQISTVGAPEGIEREYRRGEGGRFVFHRERPTRYDPRARAFYRAAVTRGSRAWTEPYPFLPHLRTGITRAAPLFVGEGRARELRAVMTVDFDAGGLAGLIGSVPRGERMLVTVGDVVLASAGAAELPIERRSADAPTRLEDLPDAVVRAFARGRRSGRARARFEVAGVGFRHGSLALSGVEGLGIELHALVDERRLFARAEAEARSGALHTSFTSAVALGLALALSRRIARLRTRRREAEHEAARARAQAHELGTYRLLQRIGSGGMGEVWRARHTLLARDAALKLIKGSEDPEERRIDRARFFDEARLLASMRSMHTVAVHDFGVADDGRYFLVMELLDGLDLDALVRRFGPQPAARVASILAQICDSLGEAHAAGLVHQDIKPANVFLCRQAESLDLVKVLDFGLTRAVGRRRADGRAEGTPAFMAPEQARGEPVVTATDLYAVGCVGFFLLTGRLPYDVESSQEHMRAHVVEPVPELPEGLRRSLPPALVQLLTRCLAKRPEHRPASARALAAALREVEQASRATFSQAEREAFWARLPQGTASTGNRSPDAEVELETEVADAAPAATRRVVRSLSR